MTSQDEPKALVWLNDTHAGWQNSIGGLGGGFDAHDLSATGAATVIPLI